MTAKFVFSFSFYLILFLLKIRNYKSSSLSRCGPRESSTKKTKNKNTTLHFCLY